MDIKVHIYTSYTPSWESNELKKEQAPLQQVRHQHESMGEWSRRNERIGRSMRNQDVWEFKMKLKTINNIH